MDLSSSGHYRSWLYTSWHAAVVLFRASETASRFQVGLVLAFIALCHEKKELLSQGDITVVLSVMGNRFTHEGNAGCSPPLSGGLCVFVVRYAPVVTNCVLLLCELYFCLCHFR